MMCLYIEGPSSMVFIVKVGNDVIKRKNESKTNNSEKDGK